MQTNLTAFKVCDLQYFALPFDQQVYSGDDIEFQRRVLERSGLAKVGTYLPAAINPCKLNVVPVPEYSKVAKYLAIL
jgi:hypothetical protein